MSNSKRTNLKAFLLGVSALTAQIVLMREMYAVFYGNELCFGILLTLWLLWVAAGSYLGTKLVRLRFFTNPGLFSYLQFLFFLITIAVTAAIKGVRFFLNVPFGEFVSFAGLAGFSFIMLALPCLLTGFQFSFLTAIDSDTGTRHDLNTSRIYVFEAAGSAAAGLVSSLLLFRFFSNIQVVLLVFSVIFLLLFITDKKPMTAVAAGLCVILLISPAAKKFQYGLVRQYWATFGNEMQVADWRQTRYGELSVVDWEGAKFLYINGVKQCQLPDPITSEEQSSLILCQHPAPGRILLIGGGLGGLATELARYRPARVEYVEQNPQAFELAMAFSDSANAAAFSGPRLSLHFGDGRRYLELAEQRYDIIVVNVGQPATGESNRYFTREFFQLAHDRLQANGIFVINAFPSAENYMGPELLQLNAGLYQALSREFPDVLVIPGDAAM